MRYYFRPLSGNLLSLPATYSNALNIMRMFSSPIGESTFSTMITSFLAKNGIAVFVPYRGIYFLYLTMKQALIDIAKRFSSPIGESTFSTPASRTPLFIRVPELFCGAKFKNCFSISYACAAFSLILCGAAQNSFYCRENSILPIPISYNFP